MFSPKYLPTFSFLAIEMLEHACALNSYQNIFY